MVQRFTFKTCAYKAFPRVSRPHTLWKVKSTILLMPVPSLGLEVTSPCNTKAKSVLTGFEPVRAKPSRFQVCPVNHSGTSPICVVFRKFQILYILISYSQTQLSHRTNKNSRAPFRVPPQQWQGGAMQSFDGVHSRRPWIQCVGGKPIFRYDTRESKPKSLSADSLFKTALS